MSVSILADIKKRAVEILSLAEEKFTPIRIESELVKAFSDKRVVKKALRELLLEGEIFYTYVYGSSFVERSINRPLRVSEGVILVPAGMQAGCNPGMAVIRIIPGGSFGNGHHPTTRISLRGIDFALNRGSLGERELKKGALDIGTGSGVLAIAAVKLGVEKAVGIDIEAIARKEALENVEANGLSEKIEIADTEIDKVPGRFSLISANLRSPTIKSLVPYVSGMLISGGFFVVSGIREEELASIRDLYERAGFYCIWEAGESGWSGLVLERTGL